MIYDERIEEPLLINPAEENPIDYLVFDYINNKSIVRNKKNILGNDILKSKKSIQHYALNRPDLVKARTDEIKKFADALLDILRH